MKYATGKFIPQNVFSALCLIGKSGFVTRSLWRNHFGHKSERWNRLQLQLLCKRGLIERHPNPLASNCFVLSRFGRILLAKYGRDFVSPPFVSQICHDELVVHSLLTLSKKRIIHDWHLENEMKSAQMRQHQINKNAKDQKYPDAVFKVRALSKDRVCAIEYERTRKSPQRYRDILWLYSRMDCFWLVLFVYETPAIQNTIKRQLTRVNDPVLSARMAFANALDWQNDPEKAPIDLDGATFSLRELCSEDYKQAA